MSEYTAIQKSSIDKAITSLDKLRYTLIQESKWDDVDQVAKLINTLWAMQDNLEG